jgi:hypothetical protein
VGPGGQPQPRHHTPGQRQRQYQHPHPILRLLLAAHASPPLQTSRQYPGCRLQQPQSQSSSLTRSLATPSCPLLLPPAVLCRPWATSPPPSPTCRPCSAAGWLPSGGQLLGQERAAVAELHLAVPPLSSARSTGSPTPLLNTLLNTVLSTLLNTVLNTLLNTLSCTPRTPCIPCPLLLTTRTSCTLSPAAAP